MVPSCGTVPHLAICPLGHTARLAVSHGVRHTFRHRLRGWHAAVARARTWVEAGYHMVPNFVAALLLAALPAPQPTQALIPATSFNPPTQSASSGVAVSIEMERSLPTQPANPGSAAIVFSPEGGGTDRPSAATFLTEPGLIPGSETPAILPAVSGSGTPIVPTMAVTSEAEPSSVLTLSGGLCRILMIGHRRRICRQRSARLIPAPSQPKNTISEPTLTALGGV